MKEPNANDTNQYVYNNNNTKHYQNKKYNNNKKRTLTDPNDGIHYASTLKYFYSKPQQKYQTQQFIKNIISTINNNHHHNDNNSFTMQQNLPAVQKTKDLIENLPFLSQSQANNSYGNGSIITKNPLIQNCLKSLLGKKKKQKNTNTRQENKFHEVKYKKSTKLNKLGMEATKKQYDQQDLLYKPFINTNTNKQFNNTHNKQYLSTHIKQRKIFTKYPSSSLLHKNPQQYKSFTNNNIHINKNTPNLLQSQPQSGRSKLNSKFDKIQTQSSANNANKFIINKKHKSLSSNNCNKQNDLIIHQKLYSPLNKQKQTIFYSTKLKYFKNKQFMKTDVKFMTRSKDYIRTEKVYLNDLVYQRERDSEDVWNNNNRRIQDLQSNRQQDLGRMFNNKVLNQLRGQKLIQKANKNYQRPKSYHQSNINQSKINQNYSRKYHSLKKRQIKSKLKTVT